MAIDQRGASEAESELDPDDAGDGAMNAVPDVSDEDGDGGDRVRLDADCRIEAVEPLSKVLGRRIIGQAHALEKLTCAYARLFADLHDPDRPLLTGLLLGPTGVGKTETARALAHSLFGWDRAMTRVNCEEYAHGHELSKLLGSPPGYVGHDIDPLLSQESIDAPHRRAREAAEGSDEEEPAGVDALISDLVGAGPPGAPGGDLRAGLADVLGSGEVLADRLFGREPGEYVSVILFDEIEKAHPYLWNALLGILDDGMLTLGDNTATDFSRSIILMTSNVGSRKMTELLEGRSLGFSPAGDEQDVESASIEDTARSAAREVFPFEFLNRLDEVLVYHPLTRRDLERIFDKFLADIQRRILTHGDVPLLVKVTEEAKELIVDRGTDLKFGARPLRRAMERNLVDPLSRLIAASELEPGDVVEVEEKDGELEFYRAAREDHKVVA